MMCENCNQKPATVHITELLEGEKREAHLCEECAHEKNVAMTASVPSINEILSSLMEAHAEKNMPELTQRRLPQLRIMYADFKRIGRLGCARDYAIFRKGLLPFLERIQGAAVHKGKTPRQAPQDTRQTAELMRLRRELNTAIANEKYEDAARLRDRIRTLRQGDLSRMDLNKLARHAGEWLKGTGVDSDIVIACRIRLARNLPDLPFTTRCTPAQKTELAELLSERVLASGVGERAEYLSLESLSPIDRTFLVERHLISRELAEGEGARAGVVFDAFEKSSVMINEEDHLRIQEFRSGFQLEETWAAVNALDDRIAERVEYAWSEQLGYLTACPTNVGTGMRANVMLHLPVLGMTRQIEQVVQAVQKMGLVVRGLYGEGTQATGNFYQVSNQITLGKTEIETVENITSTIPTIVATERKAREALMSQNRDLLEDKVWRSLGTLRTARVISSGETLEHLSHLRLGVNLHLIDRLDAATVNQLFILTLPAHLQKIEGRVLEPRQRDAVRAQFIRETLGAS